MSGAFFKCTGSSAATRKRISFPSYKRERNGDVGKRRHWQTRTLATVEEPLAEVFHLETVGVPHSTSPETVI